jgi:hypothetical protein
MSHLDSHPIPASWHDADGNHIVPRIRDWVIASDPDSPHYNPNRVVRGSEVERDQQQKALFYAHIRAHVDRGDNPQIRGI